MSDKTRIQQLQQLLELMPDGQLKEETKLIILKLKVNAN